MKKLITAIILTALMPVTGYAGEIWENNARRGQTWHDDFPTTHEIAHDMVSVSDLKDLGVEHPEPVIQEKSTKPEKKK